MYVHVDCNSVIFRFEINDHPLVTINGKNHILAMELLSESVSLRGKSEVIDSASTFSRKNHEDIENSEVEINIYGVDSLSALSEYLNDGTYGILNYRRRTDNDTGLTAASIFLPKHEFYKFKNIASHKMSINKINFRISFECALTGDEDEQFMYGKKTFFIHDFSAMVFNLNDDSD